MFPHPAGKRSDSPHSKSGKGSLCAPFALLSQRRPVTSRMTEISRLVLKRCQRAAPKSFSGVCWQVEAADVFPSLCGCGWRGG